MGEKVRVDLGTDITYGDMERLSSSSSSTAVGGEVEGIKGVDWWIMATGVEPRIPPIPGLDCPNVFSYVEVLSRVTNIGNRVAIIGVGRVGFDVKRWMEDCGVTGPMRPGGGGC